MLQFIWSMDRYTSKSAPPPGIVEASSSLAAFASDTAVLLLSMASLQTNSYIHG